jgi:Cdc6-like AAA superfamily ATPase
MIEKILEELNSYILCYGSISNLYTTKIKNEYLEVNPLINDEPFQVFKLLYNKINENNKLTDYEISREYLKYKKKFDSIVIKKLYSNL